MFNPLNCAGWATTDAGTRIALGGSCMMSKLMIVVLFFVIAMIRKWGGEEAGLEFNALFAFVGGLLSYLIMIIFFGKVALAFGIGLGVAVLLGYGGGYFFGDMFGGGDEY